MLNFRSDEVFLQLLGDAGLARELGYDFDAGFPTPTLEERAFCANMDIDTLIYGATSLRDKGQPLLADVFMADTEVLCIRLVPQSRASDELKETSAGLPERMFKAVFERLGLERAVQFRAFKQYVKEIPFNPVFY